MDEVFGGHFGLWWKFFLEIIRHWLGVKCERIEGSNNSQKLQGEGIFSSIPVTRPEFQETRGDLK